MKNTTLTKAYQLAVKLKAGTMDTLPSPHFSTYLILALSYFA